MSECPLKCTADIHKYVLSRSDGYLPGEMFGNLPFYLALTCMYMIIAVTWGVLCATYW